MPSALSRIMYNASQAGYWPFRNISFPYFTFCYIPKISPKSYPLPEGQTPKGEHQEEKAASKEKKQKNIKAMIHIENMQAGSITNASGIFSGKNIQIGWSSHGKFNSGFGTLGGSNNKVYKNTNVVFDNDQIDTAIDDRDTMMCPSPAK